jgi:hypothetical protein
LKRKPLLKFFAAIAAMVLPIAAASQASSSSAPAEPTEPVYHYQVLAGYSYTSLNQLNQSRSGLQGPEITAERLWGKHFGLVADGGYYRYAIVSGNPGTPTVDLALAGPEFHADLIGRTSGFIRGMMGAEHTGGESETPNVSFAGGFGGGMEYRMTPHLSLRASGDDIFSSFVQDPEHLGYSPHRRANARGGLGVVYRF